MYQKRERLSRSDVKVTDVEISSLHTPCYTASSRSFPTLLLDGKLQIFSSLQASLEGYEHFEGNLKLYIPP